MPMVNPQKNGCPVCLMPGQTEMVQRYPRKSLAEAVGRGPLGIVKVNSLVIKSSLSWKWEIMFLGRSCVAGKPLFHFFQGAYGPRVGFKSVSSSPPTSYAVERPDPQELGPQRHGLLSSGWPADVQ